MENVLNEQEVIKFLLKKGGRCTNFELVSNFRSVLNDPRYQAAARLKFKDIINSVATVGEFQNVKQIELKREFCLYNGMEYHDSQPSSLSSDCAGYTSPISQNFQPYWRYRLSSSKRLPPLPPRSPESMPGPINYQRSVSESAIPRNHIDVDGHQMPNTQHHVGHVTSYSPNVSDRRISTNFSPERRDTAMSQSLPFYNPQSINTFGAHKHDIIRHEMPFVQHQTCHGVSSQERTNHNGRLSGQFTPEGFGDRMSQSLPFYDSVSRNTSMMHPNNFKGHPTSVEQFQAHHDVASHGSNRIDRRQSTTYSQERYDDKIPQSLPFYNSEGSRSSGIVREKYEPQEMGFGNNRFEAHKEKNKNLSHDPLADNSSTYSGSYDKRPIESRNAYEELNDYSRIKYQNDFDETHGNEMSSQIRNISRALFKTPTDSNPGIRRKSTPSSTSIITTDNLHFDSITSDGFEQSVTPRNARDLQRRLSQKAITSVYSRTDNLQHEYPNNDSYLHSSRKASITTPGKMYSSSTNRTEESMQNNFSKSKCSEIYNSSNLYSSSDIPNQETPHTSFCSDSSKHCDTLNVDSRSENFTSREESNTHSNENSSNSALRSIPSNEGAEQFETDIPIVPHRTAKSGLTENHSKPNSTDEERSVDIKRAVSSDIETSPPPTDQQSDINSTPSGSMASLNSENESSREKNSVDREIECLVSSPPPLPPPRKHSQADKETRDNKEIEGQWPVVTSGGKVRDRVQHFDDMEKKKNTKRSHSPQTPGKENRAITPKGIGTDDEVSISVIETKLKREWNVKAAQCDYHALIGLLKKEPKLAALKDAAMGYTALHWAAKQGEANVVKLIAGAYKISPNIRSNGGYTPLHLATLFKHNMVVHLLVHTYGADPSIRDYSGKRADQYPENFARIVAGHKNSERRPLKVRPSEQQQQQKEQPSGGGSSFMRIGSLNLRKSRKSAVFASVRGRNWGSASELRQGSRVSMRKKLQRNLLHQPEKKWETDKKVDSDTECTYGFPSKKQEYI